MARYRKRNDENFWDGLLKMGGILGLGWLMVETIKLVAKEEYRCPNCKVYIKPKTEECPNCQAKFTWKI